MKTMKCENCGKDFVKKWASQRNCPPSEGVCYIQRMRRLSSKTNKTAKIKRQSEKSLNA